MDCCFVVSVEILSSDNHRIRRPDLPLSVRIPSLHISSSFLPLMVRFYSRPFVSSKIRWKRISKLELSHKVFYLCFYPYDATPYPLIPFPTNPHPCYAIDDRHATPKRNRRDTFVNNKVMTSWSWHHSWIDKRKGYKCQISVNHTTHSSEHCGDI